MTKQEIVEKLKNIQRYDVSYNQRYQSVEKDKCQYGEFADGSQLDDIVEEIEKNIELENS